MTYYINLPECKLLKGTNYLDLYWPTSEPSRVSGTWPDAQYVLFESLTK